MGLFRQFSIRWIRAKNRPKSRGGIWKRTKNVVPLHCLREDDVRLRDKPAKRESEELKVRVSRLKNSSSAGTEKTKARAIGEPPPAEASRRQKQENF